MMRTILGRWLDRARGSACRHHAAVRILQSQAQLRVAAVVHAWRLQARASSRLRRLLRQGQDKNSRRWLRAWQVWGPDTRSLQPRV
jgi:hypothetical protein